MAEKTPKDPTPDIPASALFEQAALLARKAAAELAKSALAARSVERQASGAPETVAVQFVEFSLAGARHCKGPLKEKAGAALRLEPEPSNPHDKNAIRVLRGDVRVGYVARADAAEIARLVAKEGWALSDKAFLVEPRGGSNGEGRFSVRMTNPTMGWEDYNPALPFRENKARYEQIQIDSAMAPVSEKATKPKPKAL